MNAKVEHFRAQQTCTVMTQSAPMYVNATRVMQLKVRMCVLCRKNSECIRGLPGLIDL